MHRGLQMGPPAEIAYRLTVRGLHPTALVSVHDVIFLLKGTL